jgi:membrane associated rhomboid family serine protease
MSGRLVKFPPRLQKYASWRSTALGRVRHVIPLKDENPTRSFPIVTLVLIATCIGVYFFIQPTGSSLLGRASDQQVQDDVEFTLKYAAIPCEVVEGRPLTEGELVRTFRLGDTSACNEGGELRRPAVPDKRVWLAIVVSMFLHGNLLHIAGNMLYLWVFGNNIEDHMGKVLFLLFYLGGGLAATVAHILVDPNSTVPVVGASGAIAAVMGAYLVLFPNVRIRSLIILIFFITFAEISAKWLLGFWFVTQFFTSSDSGVAWMAHVGGFVFGVLVALLVKASGGARDLLWRDDYARAPSGRGPDEWRGRGADDSGWDR